MATCMIAISRSPAALGGVTATPFASQSVMTLASVLAADNMRPTASVALYSTLDMITSLSIAPAGRDRAWTADSVGEIRLAGRRENVSNASPMYRFAHSDVCAV